VAVEIAMALKFTPTLCEAGEMTGLGEKLGAIQRGGGR
jgi:hypothetical protein